MPNVLAGKRLQLALGMWETTPEWCFMQVKGASLHLEGLLCVKDLIEKMHFRASGLSRSGSRKVSCRSLSSYWPETQSHQTSNSSILSWWEGVLVPCGRVVLFPPELSLQMLSTSQCVITLTRTLSPCPVGFPRSRWHWTSEGGRVRQIPGAVRKWSRQVMHFSLKHLRWPTSWNLSLFQTKWWAFSYWRGGEQVLQGFLIGVGGPLLWNLLASILVWVIQPSKIFQISQFWGRKGTWPVLKHLFSVLPEKHTISVGSPVPPYYGSFVVSCSLFINQW